MRERTIGRRRRGVAWRGVAWRGFFQSLVFARETAGDGARTRDPYLGKVVLTVRRVPNSDCVSLRRETATLVLLRLRARWDRRRWGGNRNRSRLFEEGAPSCQTHLAAAGGGAEGHGLGPEPAAIPALHLGHQWRRSATGQLGSAPRISRLPVSRVAPWAMAVATAKASAQAKAWRALMWAASSTRDADGKSRASCRCRVRTTSRARSAPALRSMMYETSPRLIQLITGCPERTASTRLAAGSSPSSQRSTAQESRQSVTAHARRDAQPRAPWSAPGRRGSRGGSGALEPAGGEAHRRRRRTRPGPR